MRHLLGVAAAGLAATFTGASAFAQPPPGGHGVAIPTAAPSNDVLQQGALMLVNGRAVTFSLGEKNVIAAVDEEKPANPDVAVMPTSQPNSYASTPGAIRNLQRVGQDKITLTMLKNPKGGSVLIFQNGFDRPMTLAAATSMMVDGKRRVSLSTICTAVNGKPDLESWPNDIDLIVVLQVLDSQAGTCFDPSVNKFYRDGDQPPSAQKPPPAAPPG